MVNSDYIPFRVTIFTPYELVWYMAVTNVACPYCGGVANVTVNSPNDEIIKVAKNSAKGVPTSERMHSACKNCDSSFVYWTK